MFKFLIKTGVVSCMIRFSDCIKPLVCFLRESEREDIYIEGEREPEGER